MTNMGRPLPTMTGMPAGSVAYTGGPPGSSAGLIQSSSDTPFWRSRKAFITVVGAATTLGLAWLKADPMAYVCLGAILGVHQYMQGKVDVQREINR